MKEIMLTCPFTGMPFKAIEYADGNIVFIHPLTGEQIQVNWNCSIKKYNISKSHFKYIATLTPAQAAEILDVSRQRISQIVKDQVIPVHYLSNGTPVFIESDVYHYRDTRAVGAPKKK